MSPITWIITESNHLCMICNYKIDLMYYYYYFLFGVCVYVSLNEMQLFKGLNLPLDKHIVWNAGPATRYEDKLSILSCHNAKHEPRSANTNWTRGIARERAEPLSCNNTGTPVYFKRQSLLLARSYKLASDGQTYTWKIYKEKCETGLCANVQRAKKNA